MLGNWALIDIETTGIDPTYDEIIDIGYVQFEGTKVVQKYSSLVRSQVKLSEFIQKLTGIKDEQVRKAPTWDKVKLDMFELDGHALLAHNSDFEKQFLKKYFDELETQDDFRETYHDSMNYLALLFPKRSSLKLESFMVDFEIAEKEEHRGLADSVALLQVVLVATMLAKKDGEFYVHLTQVMSEFEENELWYKKFLFLSDEQLLEIADGIDFDLNYYVEKYIEKTYKSDFEYKTDKVQMEFSGKNIQNILRNEDRMSSLFEGYTFRAAQESLSLRVGQAFKNGIHSIIQAPTGTGKSLGYLLPSALLAKQMQTQVLVSTGTKTLQNQAVQKDIPALYNILGLDKDELKVTRLVGSKNHLCELMYRNEKKDDMLLMARPFEEKFTHAYLETVMFYNERVSDYNNIVTRDGFPYVFKRKYKSFSEIEESIAVDYRACTGHKCPFKNACTYFQGIQKAKESHLIVGNHALLLNFPRSIEKPPFIVIDEAHKMESEATSAFTFSVKQRDLENFSKNLNSMIGPLYYLLGQEDANEDTVGYIKKEMNSYSDMISDHVPMLGDNIEKSAKKLPYFTDIYWNEIKLLGQNKAKSNLEAAIYNHISSLAHIFKSLNDLLYPYLVRWQDKKIEDDNTAIAFTAFESVMSTVEDIQVTFAALLKEDELIANTINYHYDLGYTLESAPINVGQMIYEDVLKPSQSVVFTSATLANHDGTVGMPAVEWMTGYNYLESDRRFKTGLFLDNNYDYEKNARVFLCTDTKPMYDTDFVPSVLEQLVPTIEKIGGRTLLLFSSRVRFEKASEILLKNFEGKIPVFIQGMGNNVVEDFKKSDGGILLGMESLGEGIDIPGNSLELVYVDKVPDLRREYVIDKRRDFYERQFGNEFNDYFLASRTRSLHQKLGRLIRRQSDKGAIIITDCRIKRWKGRTIDSFKNLMRPYSLEIESLEDACEKASSFILSQR
ncbi:MAG: exonuclease domain-containing protein [Bacteriovoracaceae bacterium]|jgi:ATP-dependent DNA helicase DinG|nr:exonuclease domain-containing protein [Bacteriovoracaceae bacterium]